MKTLSPLGSSVVTLIACLGLAACSGAQLEPVTDDPVVDDVPKSMTSLVNATVEHSRSGSVPTCTTRSVGASI